MASLVLSDFTVTSLKFALLAVLALQACAAYDGRGLVAGSSTAADIERVMGQPAEKLTIPPNAAGNERWAGDTVWFYPRNPYGRHTYAVQVAADGRVRSIEQRLTVANIEKIVRNVTRIQDARLLFGPPNRVMRFPRQNLESWEYRMFNQIDIPYNLYVQYSPDGIVREVLFLRDPSQDMPEPGFFR